MVSIIVPIYNAEDYIGRCITSLIQQTYKNIEIICVNDGSTDKSRKICEEFSLRDPRVKVINFRNRGVSVARNEGLKFANGDFFSFVDADDYVEKDYIEKLMATLKKKKVDIVYCSAIAEDKNKKLIGIEYDKDKLIQTKNYDWNSREVHCVVRGAIYPKKIIEGLKFDKNLYVGEDTYFFAQCIKRAKLVYCLKKALYHYVQYDVSASHGNFRPQMITEIDAWENIVKLFDDDTSKVACAVRCKGIILAFGNNTLFRRDYFQPTMQKYHSYISITRKYYLKTKNYKSLVTCSIFNLIPKIYIKIKG